MSYPDHFSPRLQKLIFFDQRRSRRGWGQRRMDGSDAHKNYECLLFGRIEPNQFVRFVLQLICFACCPVLLVDVSVAQVTSRLSGGGEQADLLDAERGDFAWPRKTQQDALVVFLGDSITHQGLYTQYLENFFYTRYPNLGVRFRNAGVAGDSISDALTRFDQDVASHRPDYVTVLFGMNDGRYQDFDASIWAEYQANMKRLLNQIEAIGAAPIVLSPTMFDHAVTKLRKDDPTWRFRDKAFSDGYNALMSMFGAWSWDESRRRGNAFVDLWAPLNAYTDLGRRLNSDFTLIGDAIHPQASGQVVMASEILLQLGVERSSCASRVITSTETADSGITWNAGKGVRGLRVTDNARNIEFKHDEIALPWVIPQHHSTIKLRWNLPSDGRTGFKMTNAGHRLSADRLKIAGLPSGWYEVRVDGSLIGSWSHVMLGAEVELQELHKTPQYQQSLQVAELNRRRYDEFVRPSRDLMASIKGLKRRHRVDGREYKRRSASILAKIQELEAGAEQLDREIRMLSKPQTRHWVIRRVDSRTQ